MIPQNASANGDSWKCNSGYKKSGNSCIKKSTNASGKASKRQVIPLTKETCESLSSDTSISMGTAEMIAKRTKDISPSSVDLWSATYYRTTNDCDFKFDTPKGIKTCTSSRLPESESEEVKWLLGMPMKPVLIKDPGKSAFLVVGVCSSFR